MGARILAAAPIRPLADYAAVWGLTPSDADAGPITIGTSVLVGNIAGALMIGNSGNKVDQAAELIYSLTDTGGGTSVASLSAAGAGVAINLNPAIGQGVGIGQEPFHPFVGMEMRDPLGSLYSEYRGSVSSTLFSDFYCSPTGGFFTEAWAATGAVGGFWNPNPLDGVSDVSWGFHRTTTTGGKSWIGVYIADGTNTPNAIIAGKGLDTFLAGNNGSVGIGATTTPSAKLHVFGGTVASSSPAFRLDQTWNNAAVGFTGALLQYTRTAAHFTSLPLAIKIGSDTLYSWDVSGNFKIDARTPGFGEVLINSSSTTTNNIILSHGSSAGAALTANQTTGAGNLDIDVKVADGSSNSTIRFGRNVSTSGAVGAFFYSGATLNAFIGGGGNSYIALAAGARFGVGKNNPAVTFDVTGDIQLSGTMKLGGTVVGSLPAASTWPGSLVYVTDLNSTTYGAAAVGGGSNKGVVFSDGGGWFICGAH